MSRVEEMITAAPNQAPATPGERLERHPLHALTGLRFLAAFFVVIYHFALPVLAGSPNPVLDFAGAGYVAVSLFFVLSGFVLCYSYLGGAGSMRGTARAFYISRFARIYPAYLAAFLIALPFNVAWSLSVNAPLVGVLKLTWGAVLVLTLLQAWTPWTAWYWNSPAWSLSAEAFFYAVFPALGPRLARLRASHCLLGILGLWFLAILPAAVLCAVHPASGTELVRGRWEMAVEFTPLLRLPEFLMGILAGRYFALKRPLLPSVAGWLSGAAAMALVGLLAFSSAIPRPLLAGGLLAPGFAVLVYALAHGEGLLAKFLGQRWMVVLGEASYGIYILQIPVSYCLHMRAPHHTWGVFATYSLALVLASLLCWRYVEGPLRGRIKKFLTSRVEQDRDDRSAGILPRFWVLRKGSSAC